jgi:baculoviral IAP repeat-containing protein 6
MDDLAVFTPQMAQEAVLFCTAFMRNDLVSSPVLQDCLLSVMDMIINAGSSDTTARDNVYFGAKRGLAGIVMDSSAIRMTTAPVVMELYNSVQHAEGINSDEDQSFNKHTIRHKISRILEKLYRHPLPESKSSILTFLAGDKFDSFLVAAIDTVVYMLEFGIKALHEGLILENNRGASLTTPESSPEYEKLQSKSRTGFLQANITFDMLAMLFENEIVRERFAMSRNSTQTRVVASLWTFIEWNCIDCELLISSIIADSDVWRGGESTAVSFNRPCSLLSICLSSNKKLLKMLLDAPTFDLRIFEGAAGCKGGKCLQPYVAALSSASAAGVGGVCLEVPWEEWLSEVAEIKEANSSNEETESGIEPFVPQYTSKMIEVGQVMATSFTGHYFYNKKDSRSRGGGGGGALAKVLMKEYKKLRKMLPSPDPSGGTMVVLFDEDDIQFARAIVTGRSDTPYFGGVFVFDVYFPNQYPHIPPLLQNLTTGYGTWRAHNNLYGDGKVCLSLLQNFSGEASEKWDPEQSSLYQVLMGIQSHILCEEPYYAAGHAKTPDAVHLSRAENRETRFKTIQHAMVSMIREQSRFGEEAAEVIRVHFGSLEGRLVIDMRRCLTEAEAENSPRLTAIRRSVVLAHKWFTKLRVGHSIDDELSLEVGREGEVASVATEGFSAIHETSQQSTRTIVGATEQNAAEAAFLKKDQNDTECKRTSTLDDVSLGREKQRAPSAASSVVSAPADAKVQSQDGGSSNIDICDSGSGVIDQQLRRRAQLSIKEQETETTEHTLALEAAARDARTERASRYKRMSQVSNGNKKGLQSKKMCLAMVGMAAAAAAAFGAFVAFNK